MTLEQELTAANGELRRENEALKGEIIDLKAKETELRNLISYLNNLGPKPANLNP